MENYKPLLVSRQDFKGRAEIPENLNNEKLDKSIREAQRFDIRPEIGKDFLLEILEQSTLSSSDVGYNADFVVLIEKLSDPVVYYSYARLLEWLPLNVGRFGLETKNSQYGTTVSDDYRKQAVKGERAKASAALSDVIIWLNSEESPDFGELWNKSSCADGKKDGVSNVKMIKRIGRNYAKSN